MVRPLITFMWSVIIFTSCSILFYDFVPVNQFSFPSSWNLLHILSLVSLNRNLSAFIALAIWWSWPRSQFFGDNTFFYQWSNLFALLSLSRNSSQIFFSVSSFASQSNSCDETVTVLFLFCTVRSSNAICVHLARFLSYPRQWVRTS